MEEILASIRRIINQDEADNNVARGPAAEVGDTEPASYAQPPAERGNGALPPRTGTAQRQNGTYASHLAPGQDDPAAAGTPPHIATQHVSAAQHYGRDEYGRRPPPPGAPVTPSVQPAYEPPADDYETQHPDRTPAEDAYYDAEDVDAQGYDAAGENHGADYAAVYTPDEGSEDDVLNLTEMVGEDGQVVSIQPASDVMDAEDGYEDYYEQYAEFYEESADAETGESPGAPTMASLPEAPHPEEYEQHEQHGQDGQDGQYEPHGQPVHAGLEAAPTQRREPARSPFRTDSYSPRPDDDDAEAAAPLAVGRVARPPEPAPDHPTRHITGDVPTAVLRGSEPTRRAPVQGPAVTRPVAPVVPAAAAAPDDDEEDNRVDERRRRPTGRINRGASDAFSELAGAPKAEGPMEPLSRSENDMSSPPAAPGSFNGDSALERMVHEALRPMLRDWLDQNLPVLIEQVVRKELQRIFESRNKN